MVVYTQKSVHMVNERGTINHSGQRYIVTKNELLLIKKIVLKLKDSPEDIQSILLGIHYSQIRLIQKSMQ